ncbi:hypothetical protein TSEDIMI_20192 [Tenacibaculum sediminilitoris]|uniref:hypothetical protein n=1 Tax=Tenacibaculum sediminilitoris TaxID=1820334 RepID=UPI0038961B6B
MGNRPTVAIDPDGGDIIILTDSKAVARMGHGAVLIGNDKDGWRYLSMNGTSADGEGGGSAYGDSVYPDLGNYKQRDNEYIVNDFRGTGMTAEQVMVAVNKSNKKHTHHYDKYIRITTSVTEDNLAFDAAKDQASHKKYGIFGVSCIDVPQETLARVFAHRKGKESLSWYEETRYGFDLLLPNAWRSYLLTGLLKSINTSIFKSTGSKNDFKYTEGRIVSPRHF